MAKIKGTELLDRIKESIFMARHFVDASAEYLYIAVNAASNYEAILEALREARIVNPRSVTIDDLTHYWKPVGEETLKPISYSPPAPVEKPAKVDGRAKRRVQVDLSFIPPGKQMTLDQIMKKAGKTVSRATVTKALKAEVEAGRMRLLKKKPFTIKISK